jgi:hypothetical protein
LNFLNFLTNEVSSLLSLIDGEAKACYAWRDEDRQVFVLFHSILSRLHCFLLDFPSAFPNVLSSPCMLIFIYVSLSLARSSLMHGCLDICNDYTRYGRVGTAVVIQRD